MLPAMKVVTTTVATTITAALAVATITVVSAATQLLPEQATVS